MVFKILFDEHDKAVSAEPFPELDISPELSHIEKTIKDDLENEFYVSAFDEGDAIRKAMHLKQSKIV